MLNATKTTLFRLAALIWFTGVVVLLVKSVTIIREAIEVGVPVPVAVSALAAGVIIGMVKAKYLFIRICKKNIERIQALESPKIWQAYRTRFYFFLILMITFGKYAYHFSNSSAFWLTALAILELSISTALFISGNCFRKIIV